MDNIMRTEIRKGAEEVQDVQNLVETLCNPNGDSKASDFWTKSAKSLLAAVILHVLYAEENKSLAGVSEFIRSPTRDLEDMLNLMKDTPHKDGRPHPLVEQSAQSLLNMADKTRSGVVATAERLLTSFNDPLIASGTADDTGFP